ncbi:MAG: AAA family ATPase [Syntrophobacterales bacterium]|nr:AAA family ATPase [Syntrophobacterales bacterium]
MAGIIYGIEEKKGFVAVTGAVGVGKTTILRYYLEKANKNHLKIIYIFNARLTFEGLVRTIYEELGIQTEGNDVLEMVNRLYGILIEEYKQGNTVVIVIDEAQNMPVDTLEDLRMLSNLETSKDKLIQIVLVGQPEFEHELALDRLRQLRQRLAIRTTILPLTKQESLDYIRFRLIKAGSNGGPVFTNAALKIIVKKAKGIPRVINILCDNALITGFGYQRKPVTAKIVREVADGLAGSKPTSFLWWWILCVVILASTLLGIIWLLPEEKSVQGKTIMSLHERKKLEIEVKEAKQVVAPADEHEGASIAEAKEVASSSPSRDGSTIKKIIVQGDTLTKLSLKMYGYVDDDLVRWVQKNNQHISDPDIIPVGITVTFPKLSIKKAAEQ